MPETAICLDAQTLQDFLLGRLPATQAEVVTQHLEECSRCVAVARTLEPLDPLVTALRQARIITRTPLPPVITNLMESMRRLRPRAVAQTIVSDVRGFLAPPRNVGELGWLGPYRVLRELGSGGMGIVYLAEDPHLQRQVAIKVMQSELAVHPIARERFVREARAAAALENDHVVTIHQVGEDGGVPYMVMPLLQGETLAARLQRDKVLPIPDALRFGREMAIGLSAAHDKGMVHRDIKPANIWLETRGDLLPARVKLLDFGLAWAADEHSPLTPPEVLIGTPAYLAPEMVRGETVDARSDLFSLGCVIYEMLTGRLAFGGGAGDSQAILKALARDVPPPRPETFNPQVPSWLADLVMQLLSKPRDARPESAKAVLAALQKGSVAQTQPGIINVIRPPPPPSTPVPTSNSTLAGTTTGAGHTLWEAPLPARKPEAQTPAETPRPAPPPPRRIEPPKPPPSSKTGREIPQTPEKFCELFALSRLQPADTIKEGYKRWRKAFPQAARDMDHMSRWLVTHDYLTEYQSTLLKRGHVNHFYLNKYKIMDRIGVGRMAGVYKAVHELGQLVAIKVLPPSMAKDKVLLGRFHREARLAMKLKHPNIVRTFEVGVAGEKRHQYLVMEYLEGETLAETLERRGKLPPQEAARLIYQAMLGLEHIHEQGMVHRDLKPANLMLVPQADPNPAKKGNHTVKILDIGLGRGFFDEADPGLTEGEAALGTPSYMAPEQARDSHNVDIRADLYSLGCTLYHCLTGQTPFPSESPVRIMLLHATEKAKPLRQFNPDVPDGLQQVLDVLMAKDPALRYPTPERAAQALQPFLSEGYQPSMTGDQRMMSYLEWLEEYGRDTENVDVLGGMPEPSAWEPNSSPNLSRPRASRPPTPRPPSVPELIPEPPPAPVEEGIPVSWVVAGVGIAVVSLLVGGVLAWVIARGMGP